MAQHTGLYVTCGASASDYSTGYTRQPIFGDAQWTRNFLAAGTCPEAAGEKPVLRFKASGSAWTVAIARQQQSAPYTTYHLIRDGEYEDFFCKPGDIASVAPYA